MSMAVSSSELAHVETKPLSGMEAQAIKAGAFSLGMIVAGKLAASAVMTAGGWFFLAAAAVYVSRRMRA